MRKTPKSGFTLVEVLVSALALMIALFSASSLFRSVFAGVNRAYEAEKKLLLCQAALEEIKSRSFEEACACDKASFAGGKGRISVMPIKENLLAISIELSPVKLSTMRSKY